jgi:hypothetical protein
MFSRHRRLVAATLALIGISAAVMAMHFADSPIHTFRITLGLKDKEPTDWSGKVTVSCGEVAELGGWRFDIKDKDLVLDKTGWKCRTRKAIAPEHRLPVQPASGKPKTPAVLQPWPTGITLRVRGATPAVTLTFPKGELKFDALSLLLGEPKYFLDGAVRVERLPAVTPLRPPAPPKTAHPVQDDYPAFWVRYKTGKQYLAWVAYQNEKDRVLLVERDGPEGSWSEPIEVAGPGDHFRVALASTHDDALWIVWSSQREHNWDLYGRPYRNGKLGEEIRLTEAAGPDIWHSMTTDYRGRAWLVWQGFRDGQSDIFARCADGDGWHEPVRVSDSKANDWNPSIAADPKEDRVWIGWDSYETGSYSVRIRSLAGGPKPVLGEVLLPEKTERFQAHINLACDHEGRLWAAWDEAGAQWGKDSGYLYQHTGGTRLYQSRSIRIQCLVDGKWLQPAADFEAVLSADMKEYNELPQLQPDSDGRMWMAFRHRTCRTPRADGWAAAGRWDIYATAYLGDRWLAPFEMPRSGGRNDMRISSQRDRSGQVYFAYASDNRAEYPPMGPHNLSIAVSRLANAAPPKQPKLGEATLSKKVHVPAVHPHEKEQVARIRQYKVETGGKTYHIYRGDLHRHTDISQDGMGDGSLMDLHRYGLDAASLDYITVTDHNMGQDNEYCWWRTQKANDLYTVPGVFISMYGYERSVRYPNGHRNVIWTERGHRTLPLPRMAIPKQMADDTRHLYEYLRRTDGICTSHTSATDQGTNWAEEIDGSLEPFVELFQGYHTSYEAPGAPRSIDAKSDIIHGPFKPDGYVSHALDKGYRLGFQASSDHISTHVSYACILAEEFSRKGLVDAMRKRHSYAATDNIVLDVRMGSRGIMGDEVRTSQPRLDVTVLGTGPIDRVEVIRNGEVSHTEPPDHGVAESHFHWEDPAPRKGETPSYYYVRVIQKDGQMAWASPIWVRVGN